MACASVSVEPPVTECPVCHEDLTEPKILPCAHLLCKACLLSWLQAHPDPHCPLCRCAILEPGHTTSPQDVAEHLPSDLTMAALVASTRTLRDMHVCCVCDDVSATSVCLDCGDMFCASCTKLHQKQSVTRHHAVEDLSTMTAERLTAIRRPSCVTHTNEPSSLFCPTHGVSVCILCATPNHRACPEVQELQERVAEARVVLAELAATLTAGEAELEKAISELDRHMLETERQADTALADIDAACDRLQKAVDACRCRLKELTLKAKDDVRTAVNAGKTVLVARRGKLTSHRRLVELAQQTAPPACIDEVKATLHARVKKLDCSILLPAGSPIINKLTLLMDQSQLSKRENEIKVLGSISAEPSSVSVQLAFRFHGNHGHNIVLSNDGRTAERVRGDNHGIVVSSQAMVVNTLYEVKLENNDPISGWSMPTGVTLKHPAQLVLPPRGDNLKDAFVFYTDRVYAAGTWVITNVGAKLLDMPVGRRLGVLVDTDRCLHLYIDGVDRGRVASPTVPHPCYALFDVLRQYRKITALPVKTILP